MSHRELAADGVVVAFGERQVLNGAHLSVPMGRRLALLGANGSGKTTLLRTLSGSVRPSAGRVLVDSRPVTYGRSGLTEHRQVVQLVTQDPDDQLFAADVQRDVSFGPMNLGLPASEVRDRVAQALSILSISDLAERPIHELSYGQRKRVAIAGALAMQPCVVLLDEPTAGLDPQGVEEMVGALEGLLAAQKTVVIATHDVDFALRWADSVAVLVDGQISHGGPGDMLSDATLLARARLRRPSVLDAAACLGLTLTGIRDTASLVDAVRSSFIRVDSGVAGPRAG